MNDDYAERLVAFAYGLEQVKYAIQKGDIPVDGVYFPYKIGCGYGHGDWQKYPLLLEFAKDMLPLPCYLCHL